MEQKLSDALRQSVGEFRLPRYEEIPNVGLYLEQTAKYVNEYYQPLSGVSITGSMISNYVKKGLVSSPVKKQYSREQIAYLIYIALAKSVLSLDNIRLMIALQQQSYEGEQAYNYFCRELENAIQYVFGAKDSLKTVGAQFSEEKTMLRNTIIAVAHKIYLEKYFRAVEAAARETTGNERMKKA